MTPSVPVPAATPYRLALVCLGNICRSPMAHVVLEQKLAEAGLAADVVVSSAGTGRWHLGDPMDRRAAATLRTAGYDPSAHRARHFERSWLTDNDLILVMDSANLADVRALGSGPVRMFRDFDPVGPGEVPDPYYDDRFDAVLSMVERTCAALVAALDEVVRRR